jgi:hypothetical protein
MINWLYSVPEIWLAVLAAALLAALMTFLPRVVRRIPALAPSDVNSDFVLRIQGTLFTMTSLVLAFTLVQADSNFRRVDALVSAEASQIDRLDRLLARYGDATATDVRVHLRTYLRSIIEDDWPAMLRDSESEKTRQAFAPVSRGVLALNPSPGRQTEIYSEMLRTFDAVAESRDVRLNAISMRLPTMYWVIVLFSALMLIFVSSTILSSPFRSIILGCQMAVVGGLIGFVFITDQPFLGETAVDTTDHMRALRYIEARNP